MDLLEHPDAQTLLKDADLPAGAVRSCAGALEAFLARYLPRFYRKEQRDHAATVLRGKLSGLSRKTTEPIAAQAGQRRRPLQLFVGAGGWDDRAVRGELRAHAREELGHAEAVWVLDGSGFPKKGADSCGAARQWCGRLGKVDNCQLGVFLAYAAPRGCALLDCQLYLPADWAADRRRRARCRVPPGVTFQESWRIGLGLLDRARADLPGRRVTGDDEFGRCSELRAALRRRRLRYVLDVPSNTLVRDVSERRPPARPGGKPRLPAFERADRWAARQPAGRWRKVKVRDGAKGPHEVTVLLATVQTREAGGRAGGYGAAGRAARRRPAAADVVRPEQRPGGGPGGVGAGAWGAAPGRGAAGAGQGGGGAGPLRGALVGGLGAPHDAVAAGAVVLADRAAAAGGEKRRR